MEHIPQSKAQKFEHGSVTSWEYPLHDARLNLAPIAIRGRYPESGYTSNTQSDSVIHVIGGTGMLALDNGTFAELAKGDQVHLAVGDVYYFEGNLEILYAATPPWTPEQTEHRESA